MILPSHLSSLTHLTTPASIFFEILNHLPVELSSIFTMYTHDLNKRMANNQQHKHVHDHDHAHNHHHHHHPHSHSHPHEHDHTCKASTQQHINSPFPSYSSYIPTCSPHSHPNVLPSTVTLSPLLTQISGTKLFQCLTANKPSDSSDSARSSLLSVLRLPSTSAEFELATLLLYACPQQIFAKLSPSLREQIEQLRTIEQLPKQLQRKTKNNISNPSSVHLTFVYLRILIYCFVCFVICFR
jgi:hypothetical protein